MHVSSLGKGVRYHHILAVAVKGKSVYTLDRSSHSGRHQGLSKCPGNCIDPEASAGAGGALQKPEMSECWDSNLLGVRCGEGAAQTFRKQHLCSFSSLQIPHPSALRGGRCTISQPPFYQARDQEEIPKLSSPAAQRDVGDISSEQAGTSGDHAARASAGVASAFNEPMSC